MQGWMRNDDEMLEPMWSCCSVLPSSLIDLLVTDDREEEEEVQEQEQEDEG